MVKSKQKNGSHFEQSLKRLEYDMEWNLDRAAVVRKRMISDMRRLSNRRRASRFFIAIACMALLVGMGVFLEENSPIQLFQQVAADKESATLEAERESLVYPLDAQVHIEAIIGEPSITNDETYAAYFYVMGDRTELIHIHSQKNEYTVDEMMNNLLPHKKYPSTAYKATEIKVTDQRAILTESNREYGGIDLKVVTKEYVYSFHTYLQIKDMTQAEKEQLKNDLIELAALFNY